MAGFGGLQVTSDAEITVESTNEQPIKNQLIVQQIKITDVDGNLRAVYPSKTDLQFDENLSIIVERD